MTNSIEDGIGTSKAENKDHHGEKLLESLIQLNQSLVEKGQEVSSIKNNLKAFETSVNTQTHDLIDNLAVLDKDASSKFLEIKSKNDELREIK